MHVMLKLYIYKIRNLIKNDKQQTTRSYLFFVFSNYVFNFQLKNNYIENKSNY